MSQPSKKATSKISCVKKMETSKHPSQAKRQNHLQRVKTLKVVSSSVALDLRKAALMKQQRVIRASLMRKQLLKRTVVAPMMNLEKVQRESQVTMKMTHEKMTLILCRRCLRV